jgi:hypothetical protein
VSAPVPARTWHSTGTAAFTLSIEQTDGGASGVQLWIGDTDGDGVSVLLDRAQTGELVTDLLRRLALIGGRHAAVRAAADPSIAEQRGPRPAARVWTIADSGRDALRGPESAETGLPGGLTPPDPRSPGSVDAGGAR